MAAPKLYIAGRNDSLQDRFRAMLETDEATAEEEARRCTGFFRALIQASKEARRKDAPT